MDQPGFIVAFRTHRWTPSIARMAARTQAAASGCQFLILADETNGAINTAPFKKCAHTIDFSHLGLPAFPPGQVLWYNADYPLYTLQQNFPAASHFIVAEYDAAVNIPLLPIFQHAAAQKIDLIAHNLSLATASWEWTARVAAHFSTPLHAFMPLTLISARGISHLLQRRQTWPEQNPKEFEDWPFCEAFIPTVLAEMPGCRTENWRQHADTSNLTLARRLDLDDERALRQGCIAHPVRPPASVDLARGRTVSAHPGGGAGDYASWEVDLGAAKAFQSLVMQAQAGWAAGQLIISTSRDRLAWAPQGALPYAAGELGLTLPAQVTARWIRITLIGQGMPEFKNVQIFAPAA
jgi:hypothetical protein